MIKLKYCEELKEIFKYINPLQLKNMLKTEELYCVNSG